MNANYRMVGGSYEHRLIAATKLGRELEPGEQVHHINGDKTDNRPENLDVLSKAAHTKIHSETPITDREVADLIRLGWSYLELQRVGVSTGRILWIRRELGLRFRVNHKTRALRMLDVWRQFRGLPPLCRSAKHVLDAHNRGSNGHCLPCARDRYHEKRSYLATIKRPA